MIANDAGASRDDFVETSWLGRTLRVGRGLDLHVVDPTPRCRVITLAHGEAAPLPTLLRTAARNNSAPSATMFPGVMLPAAVGAYAAARARGSIREGDGIELEA